ncbi:hypothetical protein BC833DRAFT_585417 [Globomyces pollinis-pini]|nr:hypothetical protein BC833DRAFT_585417 [Globomyces pollinis-pini]
MNSIKLAKKQFRKEMKLKLKDMDLNVIEQQSLDITNQLIHHPIYQKSNTISLFLNMPTELNTIHILKHIFDNNKTCFIPYCTKDTMDMLHLKSFEDFQSLKLNSWGIPEPTPLEARISIFDYPENLDLVIMPGLAFDKQGNRIGYGKGYYDRFLVKCSEYAKSRNVDGPKTIAIGLLKQFVDSVPVEETDIKPDIILSPNP